jgi:hypothetical protein
MSPQCPCIHLILSNSPSNGLRRESLDLYTTRTRLMVLAFFDSQGVVSSHYVPKGKTMNSIYVAKVLLEFLRQLRKKRSNLESGEWSRSGIMLRSILQNWWRSAWQKEESR